MATAFHSSWYTVYRAVQHAVLWALAHPDESGIEAIGIDEIQYRRGDKYLTLVFQIDSGCRRLLWVGRDRTEQTLHSFLDCVGDAIVPSLKYVCGDMWKGYLQAIRDRAGDAVHVLDRYHIMPRLNKDIDKVPAGEARRMKRGWVRVGPQAFTVVPYGAVPET